MNNLTALITGASRGIGKGIASILAQNGYNIIAIARSPQGLEKLKDEIETKYKVKCYPFSLNIEHLKEQDDWFLKEVHNLPEIDLLVNNAGIAPERRMDILECIPESYDHVLSTNLRGPFFFTQKIAKRMIQTRIEKKQIPYNPRIIFITSISSNTASPSRAEYCISKAGLSMTAQLYAVRLSEYNIPVFEIRPGIIMTDMTEPVKEKYDKLIQEGLLLQKRWGTPEDIGKCVKAIADGLFDYATGSIFEISGGFSVLRL
ncbi:MAG TPA: 3-ketoacyl-ACP reductase [Candidatus Hydrogenedens sp.]|nr:3-ketoacyl-ACP reductase [Candidatus Hydrogenedens sp.]HOK08768.1 3-ketoacyl-ACP reductase [Candidatus Hydrogenedens sp.]HOL18924.1 3-ketoacyl-ACP reductase [Candidatus Hydrogenedens sp.]HPP57576.1 3-ketoacyl-ACP reductase [Candidatus Hydrogenedens sp.]